VTYGSLFSGIGGLDLGLERSGMSCIWQCEREPFCRKILAKHWPGVKCYEDVREIDETAEVPDLLCGGFPCQPHSVAGKRKGADDERNLWPECIRLVRLLRPRWCLFENVPGLLTTMFGQVCDELRGESYEVWPLVLGADDVGAPHRRKRLWFLAKSDSRRGRSEAGNAQHQRRGSGKGGRASVQASAKRRNGASIGDARATGEDGLANSQSRREAAAQQPRQGDGVECFSSSMAITRHERLEISGQCDSRSFAPVTPSIGVADSSRNDGANGRRKAGIGRGVQQTGEELVHAKSTKSERTQAGQAWLPRWPARPGELQHEWEASRLIWPVEPGMGESAHGLSRRMARLRREQLKALGNAVVPQVAELIGRAIMQSL